MKLNFQPAQYEKNKLDKHNSGQKTKTIIKKKPCGKHCSNPQCFKEKKLS
jgi:hypothetical protein